MRAASPVDPLSTTRVLSAGQIRARKDLKQPKGPAQSFWFLDHS